MPTKIMMHGAGGRMGRSILRSALSQHDVEIVAAVDRASNPQIGSDIGEFLGMQRVGVGLSSELRPAIQRADVVIDFSSVEGLRHLIPLCQELNTALVVGTTGLDAGLETKMDALAEHSAVLVSPNMSLGVNVLFDLVARVAATLSDEYDIEIVEMHHRAKVDAPSGTAKRLLEAAAEARGANLNADVVYGREGMTGARPQGQIGMMTLRGGDVVGDHTVIFAGPGERIELTHKAHTREIFASGAVRAAVWLAQQPKGRYTMRDVLNLKAP